MDIVYLPAKFNLRNPYCETDTVYIREFFYTNREIMNCLQNRIESTLKKWHQINQSYPLFRNGIIEEDLNLVNDFVVVKPIPEKHYFQPIGLIKLRS